MKAKTISQAKNTMRRALRDLVDPPPSRIEEERLRLYFDHSCAYCGAPAKPRYGHIDHSDSRGGNALGNLLLACATCNGDEKLDTDWRAFLEAKCPDRTVYGEREKRILNWRRDNPIPVRHQSASIEAAMLGAEGAIAEFEAAYCRLKAAVASSKTPMRQSLKGHG